MSSKETYLIVDDNLELRQELASYLNRYGISTIDVENAQQARDILNNHAITLAIVDVIMPGETGLELTRWIDNHSKVPVILLTSLDEPSDKVAGLELGADDYIVKPFDQRELLARARAILRRNKKQNTASIDTKNKAYSLNTHTSELTTPTLETSVLRDTESRLLEILINADGETVSRETLYERIYERPWNPVDRAIDNLVVKLRRLIEEDASNPLVIKTVRNKGYSIDARLFLLDTPQSEKRD